MSRKIRRAVNRSHQRSIEENVNISHLSDIQWSVPSCSDPDEVYMVEKNGESGRCRPCERAGLVCAPCNICSHCYSCTCPDYLIHDNICKHIHRVVMQTIQGRDQGRMGADSHQEGVRKNVEITNILDNLWLVPSFTDINKVYVVEKNDTDCGCSEGCDACNICVHSFSCSCPVFTMTSIVCKHIHKVAWETLDERSSDSDCRSSGSWEEFKWTKLRTVERRHERSVNARVEVKKISNSKYLVPSFINASIEYTVESNGITNCSVCRSKDRCIYCNICVHSYTCSCPDYDENYSICMHIHKVACQKNIDALIVDEEYALDAQ